MAVASPLCFFFLLLLPLTSQTPIRSPQSLLEFLGEDLEALLSASEVNNLPASQDSLSRLLRGQHPLHNLSGPPAASPNHVWLEFFKDFMSSQKKFRGRSKKMAQQGCFGIKLDRIGTFSGLGC